MSNFEKNLELANNLFLDTKKRFERGFISKFDLIE